MIVSHHLRNDLLLYAVTDRKWTGQQSLTDQVASAIRGGATMIQLREKSLSKEEFIAEAIEIKKATSFHGVPLIINDNIEVAKMAKVDGVHVGKSDHKVEAARIELGAHAIIGASVRTVEEALLAERSGADYLGVGAVFETSSKKDAVNVKLDTLKQIVEAVSIPVVAIGGINASNISQLSKTGIDGIAAIKIGMVSSPEIIETIVVQLTHLISNHSHLPIVIDPVMVSTSGSKLITDQALDVLKNELLPLATLITPNIPEAEILSGHKILNKDDMIEAAHTISKEYHGHILIKGGHLTSCSDDLHFHHSKATWLQQARINNPNTHGTGCTLSTAIACALSIGLSMDQAILQAKTYITGALKVNFDIGKGSGPLYHSYNRIKST